MCNENLDSFKHDSRIAVVVGNGLTISFANFLGIQETWNSQEFLSWEISHHESGKKLLNLFEHLNNIKLETKQKRDFDIFKEETIEEYCEKHNIEKKKLLIEARHYITYAFSELSIQQIEKYNKDWEWHQWVKTHRNNIACAYSLNYDLLLENIFKECDLNFDSISADENLEKVPLSKPHGSVDFETIGIDVPISYPLKHYIDLNDTPIKKIAIEELRNIRIQPLCIAPNEENKYIKFQWVTSQKNRFLQELKTCSHCVFIGISYFECDRPEINEIIENIPSNCEIVIANPSPPEDFKRALGKMRVVEWNSLSGPVDSTGKIIDIRKSKVTNKPKERQYIMKHENGNFECERIVIDKSHYKNCTFKNCILEYQGGQPPVIDGCKLIDSQFLFSNHAANTVSFLRLMRKIGLKDIFDSTFP